MSDALRKPWVSAHLSNPWNGNEISAQWNTGKTFMLADSNLEAPWNSSLLQSPWNLEHAGVSLNAPWSSELKFMSHPWNIDSVKHNKMPWTQLGAPWTASNSRTLLASPWSLSSEAVYHRMENQVLTAPWNTVHLDCPWNIASELKSPLSSPWNLCHINTPWNANNLLVQESFLSNIVPILGFIAIFVFSVSGWRRNYKA